jgi:hypothetical protein
LFKVNCIRVLEVEVELELDGDEDKCRDVDGLDTDDDDNDIDENLGIARTKLYTGLLVKTAPTQTNRDT